MDRTMYGKVQPGTYHPYRCTRKNGSSPGCKYIHRSRMFEFVITSFEEILVKDIPFHTSIRQNLKMDEMCTVQETNSDFVLNLGILSNFLIIKGAVNV
jgi:hypothetical protein